MKTFHTVKPLTGRHMFAMFVAFFGVVFAVNILMAAIDIRSWTGLVVENSYVASQNFNGDIASLKEAAALGIAHRLHVEGGKLILSLQDADGKAVDADNVQIQFERPFGATSEQNIAAARTSSGQYEASAKLTPGIWNGQLTAQISGGKLWRQPFRLIVKGG